MTKQLFNPVLILILFLSITIRNTASAQSGKSKKAHEAILKGEFDKAEDFIKEINNKNEQYCLK